MQVVCHIITAVMPTEVGPTTSFNKAGDAVGSEWIASTDTLTVAWIPAFAGMTGRGGAGQAS